MSATTTTALPAGLTTGTWAIDASHTEASFTVRHAGISKVRGSVAVTEGTITVGEDLASTSVTVTLDPSTVSTGDANRDGHLKSGDFFDVEAFGAWTFASTEVTGHDLVPDTTISLVFEDGNLSANAGCNTMSAAYEVTDGNIAWSGPAAATMMACSDELTAQDEWLTELLTGGVDATQDGDTLTLTDVDLEIVLEAQ